MNKRKKEKRHLLAMTFMMGFPIIMAAFLYMLNA